MSNARIVEILEKLSEPLGLTIGPVVVKQGGKAEAKVTAEGRPVLTLVYGDGGVERVAGMCHFKNFLKSLLVKRGLALETEVNPNHSTVYIFDYENPSHITYKKGPPLEDDYLLLEVLCEHLGVC